MNLYWKILGEGRWIRITMFNRRTAFRVNWHLLLSPACLLCSKWWKILVPPFSLSPPPPRGALVISTLPLFRKAPQHENSLNHWWDCLPWTPRGAIYAFQSRWYWMSPNNKVQFARAYYLASRLSKPSGKIIQKVWVGFRVFKNFDRC